MKCEKYCAIIVISRNEKTKLKKPKTDNKPCFGATTGRPSKKQIYTFRHKVAYAFFLS